MLVMMFLFIFVYFAEIPLNDAHCMDIHHHIVSQGLHYVPGPNPCTLCICDKGNPKWCKQVLCSPPQNCKSFEVGNSCCEFKCLDDILSKSDNYSETYDLALRLIASAVTAVLSLSLLFFLIHRLRQRKIRLRQNRQMSEDQRSLNSIGYITGSLGYLPGSIGYLGSGNNEMEFHYDESNVHYPLWKPPGNYFPRGEAPPPYEEAVRAARTEAEMANNQVNTAAAPPFTFSSNRNENVSLTLVHNTHVSITPSVQQTGVASSQCNVMLHQSNLQAVQPEPRVEVAPPEVVPPNQTNSSTSVSLACGSSGASHDYVIDSSSSFIQNATLESQVDVHYENYNHHNPATVAPVVTVSVKNEESFPKQALSVDFLRDRIDRNAYPDKIPQPAPASLPGTSNESHQSNKNENTALSCSSSWRREAAQHVTPSIQPSVNTHELKQKLMDKKQNYKIVDSVINTPSSSKSYRSENQLVDPKYKKCNIIKDARSGKSLPGRTYDKQRQQQKCHATELHKDMLLPDLNKHRTIPQKFSKTLGNFDSEICYVNTAEFTRKKDDDFSEHCDLILKQHNIDKIRYAAEKLDKQKSEKTLNASIRNSLCATAELRNAQKRSGILRSDMSSHRTLPKNLRELSEAFYFNFENTACEEVNLECLVKKTVPRNLAPQTETTPLSSACIDKPLKNDAANPSQIYTGNGTFGRQKIHSSNQEKKSIMSTNSSNNVIVSSCNIPNKIPASCYRNAIEPPPVIKTASDKCDLNKDIIEPPEIPPPPLLERDRRELSCVSYRCNSPVQDDVDDYRSECENCKSLSFEDCNDEEGDLLNETMTLQRRPMEQGEEHSFYRTSLTLPSHTKKTARSVTLNTPRESWFMAMQEITSSSESD